MRKLLCDIVNMGKNPQKSFQKDNRERKGRLPEDVIQYYRRVSTELSQKFEDDGHQDVFLKNVFSQLCSEGLKVAQNQTVSTIIESLLKSAKEKNLCDYFYLIKSDFETACCDRFASHVTQTLLLCCHRRLHGSATSDEELTSIRTQLTLSLIELYEFIHTNFIAYVEHTYACHIICTFIEIFGSVSISDVLIKSRKSFKDEREKREGAKLYIKDHDEVDGDNLKRIKKLSKLLLKHPHFKSFLTNSCSSLVIQTLLLVTKQRLPDHCKKLCSAVVKHAFDEHSCLITHPSGSHVVEQLFQVCSDDVFHDIIQHMLDGDLVQWSIHSSANFVIQKWLLQLRTAEQFEAAFDKLGSHIEEILANNCGGVILNLAKGALQHDTRQQEMLECLMAAFHCKTPPERQSKLVTLIACFTTYEIFYQIPEEDDKSSKQDDSNDENDSKPPMELPTLKQVNYHGSVLLQALLKFTNPRILVSGILDLSKSELLYLISHNIGSHIIDAFLDCSAVGEKSREQLHKKLKGVYTNIACDKHGSRIVEKIWKQATLKQKISIAEELSKYLARVRGDAFGTFVFQRCNLELFTKRRQLWEKQQQPRTDFSKSRQDFGGNQSQPQRIAEKRQAESGKGGKKHKKKKRKTAKETST